jgi:hypothetical protein
MPNISCAPLKRNPFGVSDGKGLASCIARRSA